VFWTSEDGDVRYGLKMAQTDDPDIALVTPESGETHHISVVRRPLPRGTGTALLYHCPCCRKPRRHLYLLSRVGAKLVDYPVYAATSAPGSDSSRKVGTSGTSYAARGGACSRGTVWWCRFLGSPWDPRAVSDPLLVAEELFQLDG
jgi:hypothetical protein